MKTVAKNSVSLVRKVVIDLPKAIVVKTFELLTLLVTGGS